MTTSRSCGRTSRTHRRSATDLVAGRAEAPCRRGPASDGEGRRRPLRLGRDMGRAALAAVPGGGDTGARARLAAGRTRLPTAPRRRDCGWRFWQSWAAAAVVAAAVALVLRRRRRPEAAAADGADACRPTGGHDRGPSDPGRRRTRRGRGRRRWDLGCQHRLGDRDLRERPAAAGSRHGFRSARTRSRSRWDRPRSGLRTSVTGTVSKIDIDARRVTATIPVGAAPMDLAAPSGFVWVSTEDDRVLKIDAHTNQVVPGDTIRIKSRGRDRASAASVCGCSTPSTASCARSMPARAFVTGSPVSLGRFPVDVAAGTDGGVGVRRRRRRGHEGARPSSTGRSRRPFRSAGVRSGSRLTGGGSGSPTQSATWSRGSIRARAGISGGVVRVPEDPMGIATAGDGRIWVTSEADGQPD